MVPSIIPLLLPNYKSPSYAEKINADIVSLSWDAVDVDQDIDYYEVFFDTDPEPKLYKTAISKTSLTIAQLKSGQTYYWRIKTVDKTGNESISDVHRFSIF